MDKKKLKPQDQQEDRPLFLGLVELVKALKQELSLLKKVSESEGVPILVYSFLICEKIFLHQDMQNKGSLLPFCAKMESSKLCAMA